MYNEEKAIRTINFINSLKHTKGKWRGVPFDLLPWQDKIIQDVFGTIKDNGFRKYNTAYVEIPKKQGKSELAAAVALYLTCADKEWGAEVYGCASDRQQASIVFDVAVEMVEQCPALKKRIKPIMSIKRLIYKPTNSYYQVLSSEAFCLDPKTIIEYVDGSRKRVDEAKPGDIILGWDKNALAFAKINSIQKQQPSPIYEIITHRGRKIKVTENHKFLTMKRGLRNVDMTHEYLWSRAKELRINDRVRIALGWKGDKDCTKAEILEAWALGAWAGDGECGRFRFINTDDDIVKRMKLFMCSIGSDLKSQHSTRQKQNNTLHTYPHEHSIVGVGKRRKSPGREWIRKHFTQESRARTKKVPQIIFNGGSAVWLAFLAGYLDTDGCVPTSTHCVKWYSESRELLEGCQILLARLGINASLNKNNLVVSGTMQLRNLDSILSQYIVHKNKKRLLEEKADKDFTNDFNGHCADRITEINILPPTETLSLEIEGIHTHVTNGIVTHNTKHGLNVHGVIFDELHAQPNRDLYDVMTKGSGDARTQPLFFLITTAGTDRNSICWEVHQKALDILEGRKTDATFYPVIYGIPYDADWMEEANWHIANPSLGHTVDIEKVRAACNSAKENPAEENLFRQLRLNQWVKQTLRWMPMDKWDACDDMVDISLLRGRECYAGLDLSTTLDLTAFVLVFSPRNEREKYIVVPYFWIPEDNLKQRVNRDHVPYDVWEKQGFVRTTSGNVVDYRRIEADIKEIASEFVIKEIAYDRYNATQIILNLQDEGITMIPFGQGFKDMSPATKQIFTLVLKKDIIHNLHPVLRWNFDNVHVETDPAENIKPSKKHSTERIDGAVASIMALDRAVRNEGQRGSVYDGRGLLVI